MANKTKRRSQAQQFEDEYRRIVPKKRSKRKKSSRVRPGGIIGACIAIICIACLIAAGCLYLNSLNGVIADNIYIAGVHVGGMTQLQAIEAVKAATSSTYGKEAMVVKVLESEITIPANCCKGLNVSKAVGAAYQYGKTHGSSLPEGGYAVDITPYLQLDESAIRNHLSQLGENYNTTLSQSTWEVQGEAPDQTLVVHLGVPEYGLNLKDLYNTVLAAYNENRFLTEGACGLIAPEPIDLAGIMQQYGIAPVDAKLDEKNYKISEGTNGYGFDLEETKKLLENSEYGSTVEIPFTTLSPTVTKESLEASLFQDVLGSYTAMATSDSDRDTNLRLACEAIDGTVLMPGDTFSYNKALGNRTEERGYRPGTSIEAGRVVKTIGGGICQVSSALYYCALTADLQIVLREAHGYATEYMPLGMDAAVSWGTLDFKFKNNTDNPIKIVASASGADTTVKILGTDTKDYYVKMEYETINTYPYSITYKTMQANNSDGYRNGDYITEPYTGYDIKTYKCKYDKQTNALISRDFEATSNYNKLDAVICNIQADQQPSADENTYTPGIGGGAVSDGVGALPDE